jgi:hypothetical protein
MKFLGNEHIGGGDEREAGWKQAQSSAWCVQALYKLSLYSSHFSFFNQKDTFAAGLVFQTGVLLRKDIEYRIGPKPLFLFFPFPTSPPKKSNNKQPWRKNRIAPIFCCSYFYFIIIAPTINISFTSKNDDNHNDCGDCIYALLPFCHLRMRHRRPRYKQCRTILHQRIAFIFVPTAGENSGKESSIAFEYFGGSCLSTCLSHSCAGILVNNVLLWL